MRMHRCVCLAPLVCVSFADTAGAGEVTPTAAPFLEIDASARNAALGGSGFAITGGLHSTQWNPAGLSEIQAPYAGLMHTAWFQGLSLEWASYAADLGASSGAAISATFLRSDALPRYDEFGSPDGEFRVYDAALTAGFGHAFGPLAAGVAVKGIRQSVDDESTLGAAGDVGLLWRARTWRLAAVAQNLGPKMGFGTDKAPLPESYAVGIAAPFAGERLQLSGAAVFPAHYHDDLRFGAEYFPIEAFAVRAGYRYILGEGTDDQLTGFSYGLGFQMNQVRVDYAYRPYSDLGDTHQIGLALAVGRSMRPEPEVRPTRPTPPVEDGRDGEASASTLPSRPARDAATPTEVVSAPAPPPAETPASATAAPEVVPPPVDAAATAPPAATAGDPATGSADAQAATEPEAAEAPPAPRVAAVAGVHRSRLSALIELRSLRESGLSGGEIAREKDGRYRVVLKYFDSADEAAEWLTKASGEFGGQAFQIIELP
jgi:hypothetical protein